MSLAIVYSRANVGITAPLITIEVHLANGLPCFNLVGLADASIKEARDRVRSALINSGFEFPAKRITVNLGPADLPKDGSRFDLAIAVGIIAAMGQLKQARLNEFEFCAELALSGALRPIPGALPMASASLKANRAVILPEENAAEASLIKGIVQYPAQNLEQVYNHLERLSLLAEFDCQHDEVVADYPQDMADIIGQHSARRALEIAAAGGHNLLFCGPPGTGKTMLAKRLISILPPLSEEQALQSAAITSIAGKRIDPKTWRHRPFRDPHHTCSAVALVGGGSKPRPGEISLAHNGVLFLDELPEFERRVLDVLREPLESGSICISRAACQAEFPANFQLVAAMNPSPTGALHDGRSTSEQVLRYLNKLSGPFLDRIDLQVEVPKLDAQDYQANAPGESSATVRARVVAAREIQMFRTRKCNAELTNQDIQTHCSLSAQDHDFLNQSIEQLGLSMRAYHRVLRVSRTIADLSLCEQITRQHLAEALGYRALENLIRHLTD